jgi:hypothetical protein
LEHLESRQQATSLQTGLSNVAMGLAVAPVKLETTVETAEQKNARPQQERRPQHRPYFTINSNRKLSDKANQTSAILNRA